MILLHDVGLQRLVIGTAALLLVATIAGQLIARFARSEKAQPTIRNLNARIYAWWGMVAVFAVAVTIGPIGSVVLFAILSFLALREFITLAPTQVSDHRVLLWIFFIITPLQYLLVAIRWYGLFAIMIPVYVFLLVSIRVALTGDTRDFLARAAAVQWALMVCVYTLSHAPALIMLNVRGFAGQGAKLLLFLVIVVQLSDVFQYIFGKLFGRRPIVPSLSPNKTWEGFVLGVLAAVLVGTGIWWATPFSPLQAGVMALIIALMGFGGGLVMSAVKRDRGIKDFGAVIPGHGGILDRIDSLTFAAPVFFHLTRFFFGG